MVENLHNLLNSDSAGYMVLIASFILGILGAITSCCNFAILGAVAGYSGTIGAEGKKKQVIWSGISFLAGTIISMAIIGGITGFASETISANFGNWWKIAAGLISILFGAITLDLLPFKLPEIKVNKSNTGKGILSSMIFGLTIGGLSTACNTCCNPVFPIVLGASFLKGSFIWSTMILVVFATGYGLPLAITMIGIGLGVGRLSAVLSKFNKIIKYIAGGILIVIGFYLLITL